MSSVEEIAAAHYRDQQRLQRRTVKAVQRLWRQVERRRISESWRRLLAGALRRVTNAQEAAASQADPYTKAVLDELGIDADAAGAVAPSAFAGVASDGRPLASLLYQPAIQSLTRISKGHTPRQALLSGQAQLTMLTETQVADAGRVADGVAITARPQVGGYVRQLTLPSCERCVVLAGRWYRWNEGFLRHPRCFPAGVVVSGPRAEAATRRWYEGELAIIRTTSGQELPVTGNHPILTDRGWVPADLIQEGDHVLRSTFRQGAVPLVVPHEHQVPSRIEDVGGSGGVMALRQVPTSAEDFHGDGGHGEVDVVFPDGLLRDGAQSSCGEMAEEAQFPRRVAKTLSLSQLGTPSQGIEWLHSTPDGFVGSGGLSAALVGGHAPSTDLAGSGVATDLDSAVFQALADYGPRDAVTEAETVLALAGVVRGRDLFSGQWQVTARWDAPASPFAMETRGAYASRGHDLLLSLSGQVERDRVVEIRRVQWTGHVYNLTSTEGWYSANGLIVSNCDCRHIPASEDVAGDLTTDPRKAIEFGKVTGLSEADTKAIVEDDADPSQVINARQGMYTAGGRKSTTSGATRRGLAGQRLGARRGRRVARLRPEQIYREVGGDRSEAIRLLRLHGYII